MNELAVHPKGDYLAAADDSGVVKIYNTKTRRVDRSLRNAHTVRPAVVGLPSSLFLRLMVVVVVPAISSLVSCARVRY